MTSPEQMAPERVAVDQPPPVEPGRAPQPQHAEPVEQATPRGRKLRKLAAVAAVVFTALAVFFGVKAFTGGDEGKGGALEGSGSDAFKLDYPNRWQPFSGEELDALPGRPLAVLRRRDGDGFVVVRREKRAPRDFNAFSSALTSALEKRVPDFERRSSRTIRVGAGRAFFYSYIRKKKGTVHTVVLVPAGARSYALNTISPGGAQDVAREIARIILSFDV